MNLIDLAKSNPRAVDQYTIQQIVAVCGDGNLLDNSACSQQLREYLALQTPERLAGYAGYCLDHTFPKNGLILQDIINEVGRKLGYTVTNGRYQGAINRIGFDGLWFDGTNYIVLEVKTTDSYRINLDRITKYAQTLKTEKGIAKLSNLVVVGRQDTGDLEAQVRGSKHAWSTRLISVDALTRLMFIRTEVDDPSLAERIKLILLPFDYTRVDNIVDLVFDTQQEQEQKTQGIVDQEDPSGEGKDKEAYTFTPRGQLDAKRAEIVEAFFKAHHSEAIKKSRTNFTDSANNIAVTCAVSKHYKREYQPYWYALHPEWLEFMRSAPSGFFILGCMDRDEAYALPLTFVENHLAHLNRTVKDDRHYWHVALTTDDGHLALNISRIGQKVDITPYSFKLE